MMPEPVEPLDDTLLSLTVVNALEVAAARREGRPLGTLDVLLGILGIDLTWGWESVQIEASFVSADDLSRYEDPEPDPRGTWHNVPLTGTATRALGKAAQIAETYKLLPMPGGALALGLLADRRSAASQAMLADASIGHADLLALIQENVLDTRLDGLDLSASGPPAPVAERPMAERALAMAGRIDRGPGAGSLALLAAAIELNEDADLADLLTSMLLDHDELKKGLGRLSSHEDAPAHAAIERAEARDGEDPDAAALIVAAALEGSPRLTAALAESGLSSSELAAQVAEWRLRRTRGRLTGRAATAAGVLGVFGSILTSALLLTVVSGSGQWWQLVLLLPIWSGYPQEGPYVGLGVTALLAILVGPGVAAAQLASVLMETVQAKLERDDLWAHTGVRLSLREQRHVVTRLLNARARRMQSLRQLLRVRAGATT